MKILDILILVGSIQGFISSVLLFFSRNGCKLSNRLLSGITSLISLACLNICLMQSGIRYSSDVASVLAYTVPLLIVMPIGPLIYFYVRSLVMPEATLPPKYKLHFLIVTIDLIPYAIGSGFVLGVWLGLVHKSDEGSWRYVIDQFDIYSDVLRWCSISIYLFAAQKLLIRSKAITNAKISYLWPQQFVTVFAAFQLLWLLHLVPYLLPGVQDKFMAIVDWYPVYLPLAVLVYWLGVNGYLRHRDILKDVKAKVMSTLSNETIEHVCRSLTLAMEKDKLFLDSELNLTQLVKHTGIPQKVISGVLNQHMGRSFNEFVNDYRVMELKKRLLELGNEHLTIMGIGLECGFNSQATMQRTFKQLTKLSPTAYQLENKSKIMSKKAPNNAQI